MDGREAVDPDEHLGKNPGPVFFYHIVEAQFKLLSMHGGNLLHITANRLKTGFPFSIHIKG